MNKVYKNIVLIGMPGSGKTTIGKLLAEKLEIEFLDLDEYIEALSGETIKKIFQKGEEHFRRIETRAVEKIYETKSTVISTGGGIIKKERNIDLLRKNGIIVFIDRIVEEITKDVDTSIRPLLFEGIEKLYELYKERYDFYMKYCDIRVENVGDIDIVADSIIRLIERHTFEENCKI